MNWNVLPLGHGGVREDDVTLMATVLAVVVGSRTEQVAGESCPRAVVLPIVECLCCDDSLLADDAGQYGSADHRLAGQVFLDDGVDPAGDAGAGGHAPVGVEDDGEREGVGLAHECTSSDVGVVGVLSLGCASPVTCCK